MKRIRGSPTDTLYFCVDIGALKSCIALGELKSVFRRFRSREPPSEMFLTRFRLADMCYNSLVKASLPLAFPPW